MSINTSNDARDALEPNACYEVLASQEQFYLEEREEEVRAILIFEDPAKHEENSVMPREDEDICNAAPAEAREQAAEELIDGDADDPPLNELEIVSMLRRALPKKFS